MSDSKEFERIRAFAVLFACYLTALVAGIVAGALTPSDSPLWVAAVADAVATVVVFVWSRALDNSSLYDPYWSVAPPLLVAYFAWGQRFGPGSVRVILAALVVFAWAGRLTMNCLRRWEGLSHEDFRYVDLRNKHGRLYWVVSFTGIHFFPTVLVFLGCVPLFFIGESRGAVGALDVLGTAIALFAIYVEARADEELRRFVAEKREPGAILATGLWKTSRHPNYFGEILFWWGLGLLGLGAHAPLWSLSGAVAITALFVFISVPLMDARMLARRTGYAEHVKHTNAIIPWIPKG